VSFSQIDTYPIHAARKALKKAGCRLGKVKGRKGKVKSQNPKPGKVKAPGTKVNVTLAKQKA
jgi:beta-lactam-binding protein with PASTA domain